MGWFSFICAVVSCASMSMSITFLIYSSSDVRYQKERLAHVLTTPASQWYGEGVEF